MMPRDSSSWTKLPGETRRKLIVGLVSSDLRFWSCFRIWQCWENSIRIIVKELDTARRERWIKVFTWEVATHPTPNNIDWHLMLLPSLHLENLHATWSHVIALLFSNGMIFHARTVEAGYIGASNWWLHSALRIFHLTLGSSVPTLKRDNLASTGGCHWNWQ